MSQPPKVYQCAEWRARQPGQARHPTLLAVGITVHHTAGPNRQPREGAAEEQFAFALARAIQKAHMDGNGWSDSGHHFLVTRGGLLLEGRHGSWLAAHRGDVLRGAHAGADHANSATWGIEVEGNNEKSCMVTPAQWDALVELCAWLSVWGNTQSAAIYAHRHWKATICPGHLADRLPELRAAVKARKLEIVAQLEAAGR